MSKQLFLFSSKVRLLCIGVIALTMFQRSYAIRKYCTTKLGLRLYDGRGKEKIPVRAVDNLRPFLSFYTCGPTVYDSAHIGHASCYVRLDIIQRILRHHFRLPLVTAMNVTDIDDKIIIRANERNVSWEELARHYEVEFWRDLNRLNVKMPDVKLRVTEHIPAIALFVQTLVDKGFAYGTSDGSIYFETSQYERYGKLQKVIIDQPSATTGEKRHPSDFALWKASKPGEPFWTTNFGNGRPGWHIECSTMASHIFGNRVDFHAGGLDLRFPHHENEETQSCCYHDVPDWVVHWIHTGQLHLEGQTHKMSKSLQNTVSIAELLEQYNADEFRMLCLLSHYRSVIEFGPESMTTARNVLRKFESFFSDSKAYIDGLKPVSFNASSASLLEKMVETQSTIQRVLENDFNTASSIQALSDLVSSVRKAINDPERQDNPNSSPLIGASNVGAVLAATEYVRGQLLTYGLQSMDSSHHLQSKGAQTDNSLERVIEALVTTRSEIRQQAINTKDKQLFRVCDQLRECLMKSSSVEVKDHGKTSSWTFRKV
uniref:cysteine--tRNA ligase n=2 Tax=Anopheles atroparvus TaxID=41427 RepID=A0AAG5DKU4_ANOAO